MNLKKYFKHFLIFFLLSTYFIQYSHAQYNDLIDNPEITWIAEFSTDHRLSIDAKPSEEIIQLIKYQNNKPIFKNTNQDNWVINWIVQNVLQDQSACYIDPGLTLKLSENKLSLLTSITDTIVTFNPETYKEQIKIIKRPISSDRIKSFRANQVIYYNQKTKNFETRLISVAPIRLLFISSIIHYPYSNY